jgi:hypothetical protein
MKGVFFVAFTHVAVALVVALTVWAMHDRDRRNTKRLKGIIRLALWQDSEWTHRRMSASDWTDLVTEIQPHEEA